MVPLAAPMPWAVWHVEQLDSSVDVIAVMIPTRVLHDLVGEIVALRAQRIGSIHAQIGVGKEIRNRLPRQDRLAEFITTLENVRPPGTVRTVCTRSPKLAIVVAVVAIRAKNLRSHRAPWSDSIQVQHVRQQAGLRECAASGMHHRMARRGRYGKLRNLVQRIAGRNRAHRKVSINRQHLFRRAGSVTAQAVLILIHRWRQHGRPVAGADPENVLLRDANQRRGRENPNRFRSMRVVAVDARGMSIVVEQGAFSCIVRIG